MLFKKCVFKRKGCAHLPSCMVPVCGVVVPLHVTTLGKLFTKQYKLVPAQAGS